MNTELTSSELERFQELSDRLVLFKDSFSKLEKNQIMSALGILAFKQGNWYMALKSYSHLKDDKKIQIIGENALKDGHLDDALSAFNYLSNKKYILKTLEKAQKSKSENELNTGLRYYVGKELKQKINTDFSTWSTNHGFPNYLITRYFKEIHLAHHISKNYDVGIGVAKGGLFLTYLTELFGLKTKISEYHRTEDESTFKWITKTSSEELRNKRIIILEDDVYTGVTSKVISNRIMEFKPKSLDLAICYSVVEFPHILDTISDLKTNFYGDVISPIDIPYSTLPKAIKQLEDRLL